MNTENKPEEEYQAEQISKEAGRKLPDEEFAEEIATKEQYAGVDGQLASVPGQSFAGRDDAFSSEAANKNYTNAEGQTEAEVTAKQEEGNFDALAVSSFSAGVPLGESDADEQSPGKAATSAPSDSVDTADRSEPSATNITDNANKFASSADNTAYTAGASSRADFSDSSADADEQIAGTASAKSTLADVNSEFAAEAPVVPAALGRPLNQPEDDRPADASLWKDDAKQGSESRVFGWVALIAAIASLFVWPAVLGPVAAVVGFIATMRGSRALGIWSIVIGLISFVAYIALIPYYASLTSFGSI